MALEISWLYIRVVVPSEIQNYSWIAMHCPSVLGALEWENGYEVFSVLQPWHVAFRVLGFKVSTLDSRALRVCDL